MSALIFWIFFQARPITPHDLVHINQFLVDIDQLILDETQDPDRFNAHAEGYEVAPNRFRNLLSNIRTQIQAAKDAGEIPEQYADIPICQLEDYLVGDLR